MSASSINSRSTREETYDRASYDVTKCPPMMGGKVRSPTVRPTKRLSSGDQVEKPVNKCLNHNFDTGTLATASSIVYTFANPCGINISNSCPRKPSTHFDQHCQVLPTTPSTADCSFSDDSQSSTTHCDPYDNPSCQLYSQPYLQRSKANKEKHIYHERSSGRRSDRLNQLAVPGMSVDEDDGIRPLPPTRNKNRSKSPRDEQNPVILVGSKEYPFPPKTMGFASRYFWNSQRKRGDNYSFVDLTTHSSEEFDIVMKFFENNVDPWDRINWKNLAIVLPWFAEFQALPMLSAVDTFLLHNGVGAGRGFGGDASGLICLSNLLDLTGIALQCGLESSKLHARRLLRKSLLEPRKRSTIGDLEGDRQPVEVAEDIELEWTLDDLKKLAKLMESYDELREYLWEYAVIGFLPHDLDISDSGSLVSNNLFPYLLREGMMQMMIVQGIEASFPTNDTSFSTDSSQGRNASSYLSPTDSFISEHTSCSDTTIPTTPSNRNKVTQDEMQKHLKTIQDHLDKFRNEKNSRTAMYEEQHQNSLVLNDSALSDSTREIVIEGGNSSRSRRDHDVGSTEYNREARKTTSSTRGRGIATFAC